jgi:large subunit ribosomal protein L29
MEYKELKNKSLKELHELLNEKRDELRQLAFKAGENQLKAVRKMREIKKDIARILTAINGHANV